MKSGEIRVCADFSTGFNATLEDFHYPLPSPEEVFTKLNGGSFFSKIELSDAYLQIPVNNDTVYDIFNIEPPQTIPEPRRSCRKKKIYFWSAPPTPLPRWLLLSE